MFPRISFRLVRPFSSTPYIIFMCVAPIAGYQYFEYYREGPVRARLEASIAYSRAMWDRYLDTLNLSVQKSALQREIEELSGRRSALLQEKEMIKNGGNAGQSKP